MNDTFVVGDWIVLVMNKDGKVFEGILDEIHQDYLVVNGQGFPLNSFTIV